jgi:dihydropyrimidinase
MTMVAKVIQDGTLITAEESFKADILIQDESIAAVGESFAGIDAERIDASGKLVLPGGIDPHTHFNLPMFDTVSSDDHYTGHKAAAFGGTTTALDFVPQPDEGSLHDGIAEWHERADPRAAVDFGFHANITHLDGATLSEIPSLIDEGITTLKVFTAYNGRLRLQDGEIFQVMRQGARHGMLTMLHAENGDVIEVLVREALAAGHTSAEYHARTRPAWGAVEAFLRAVALSAQADSPLYVVHMNTAGEVDQLAYARQRGLPVMGETCPQYLFFGADLLSRPDGAKWVCSPPLRTPADQKGLWRGLTQNVIQTVGTDHCPFFWDGTKPIEYEGEPVAIPGKELGADDFTKIPNGLPGVGDRLPILWSYGVGQGRLTPNQFVALTSTHPAKIFGLYPRKGAIVPGADADIVLWDPDRRLTYGVAHAHHRTDYNLYEGWELQGFPEKVFLRGHMIVDGDRWLGKPGMGRFLHRLPGAHTI